MSWPPFQNYQAAAGPYLQIPFHHTITAPTPLSYLPERPLPNSFGILQFSPTNSVGSEVITTSWFTGRWPVLSTSYAIQNNLVPEPPELFGLYHIVDDPMDIDHPEPVALGNWGLGSRTPEKQKKRIQPTNISTVPLTIHRLGMQQPLSPW